MTYEFPETFSNFFNQQLFNQQRLFNDGAYTDFTKLPKDTELPVDDPKLCSYHVQQLVSEIGEVLEADKRWKNFRNDKNDVVNKLEEIADCFIVVMNLAIFSGFDSHDMEKAIYDKLEVVSERIQSR